MLEQECKRQDKDLARSTTNQIMINRITTTEWMWPAQAQKVDLLQMPCQKETDISIKECKELIVQPPQETKLEEDQDHLLQK